jgi:hypothetical protein
MPEPRKLFKYYIEENIKLQKEESLFQYRQNRWRFNTRDGMTCKPYKNEENL